MIKPLQGSRENQVKLSGRGVEALRARAQQDIDSGAVPACQYALAMHGEVLVHETLGDAPPDARFSIWSCTKPVFSSVVWQLMGEKKLDPAARVAELWPEFAAGGKGEVTLEHLLLFTAGFPTAELDLASIGDRAARIRQMEAWTLQYEPGTAYTYHAMSAHWVMAELVERATGTDYRQALRDRVLDPLGLDRLELGVPAERAGDLQPVVGTGDFATEKEIADALDLPGLPAVIAELLVVSTRSPDFRPEADLIVGQQPHVLAAGVPGAGGVGDAASLALFYQALLQDTRRVWDPAVLHDVTTNVRNIFAEPVFGILAMRTLGLEVQGDDETARFRSGSGAASPRTFGHGGAGGQIAWADPASGLSFVYLTNGIDRHFPRQLRRVRELTAAAVACVA
jgi:CubicO group peptidase (beta-lactamase class C family)